ncbi:MAG: ribonuclease HII [Desulfobulbus sp.]|jgi:ribonuclease HII
MTHPHPSFVFAEKPEGDDTLRYERYLGQRGYARVAGLDEAGRGPLAGPVVAACVVLPPDCDPAPFIDSKRLTARAREHAFTLLHDNGAIVGSGVADVREIEALNILQATLLAMRRALAACGQQLASGSPDFLLVDGKQTVPVSLPQLALVKGESRSASIAAASIVAKVLRDRLMVEAHTLYPQFGFDVHKGYPTRAHREAIRQYGPCPLHRTTFRGVREYCEHTDKPSPFVIGGEGPGA